MLKMKLSGTEVLGVMIGRLIELGSAASNVNEMGFDPSKVPAEQKSIQNHTNNFANREKSLAWYIFQEACATPIRKWSSKSASKQRRHSHTESFANMQIPSLRLQKCSALALVPAPLGKEAAAKEALQKTH